MTTSEQSTSEKQETLKRKETSSTTDSQSQKKIKNWIFREKILAILELLFTVKLSIILKNNF